MARLVASGLGGKKIALILSRPQWIYFTVIRWKNWRCRNPSLAL